jgi:16S rRNA pseudouridine516 synthase
VQPVGRLDEDTTGLLLLTDDGQLNHALAAGKRKVAKVYLVTTKHPLDDQQLERLRAGVVLHDDPAPVAGLACEQLGERRLRLTVSEGRYHQVKRMLAAVGNRVEALHREAVGGLVLPPELAPGGWRWLDAEELQQLGHSTATRGTS